MSDLDIQQSGQAFTESHKYNHHFLSLNQAEAEINDVEFSKTTKFLLQIRVSREARALAQFASLGVNQHRF